MKIFLATAFFFLALPGYSQDVTGIWRGFFHEDNYNKNLEGTILDNRYKIEVQLDQRDNYFDGVTYSYKSTLFYGKATAYGRINQKTHKVFLEEMKIVEVRMAGPSDACIMTFKLQYNKSGEDEFMEGTYTSINTRDSSTCGNGKVLLQRVINSDFYKEPFLVKREKEKTIPKPPVAKPATKDVAKTPTPKTNTNKPATSNTTTKKTTPPIVKTNPQPQPDKPIIADNKNTNPRGSEIKTPGIDTVKKTEKRPAVVVTPRVLATRENELVKTIITSANEISINVYDNGTVDNDTISVYVDKKLIISKQRLTQKAINVKFNLDDINDYHELVMVAENLGEIPPNTSLMVVTAGSKQYEVRITSNEQKNAVVIFKYEKDK